MFSILFLLLLIVGVFSGAKTWTRRFDLAVDMLTLSLFTKVYGVTVSSACGLALRADPNGTSILHKLGRLLNKIQTNHCELAIADDTLRLGEGLKYLGVPFTIGGPPVVTLVQSVQSTSTPPAA